MESLNRNGNGLTEDSSEHVLFLYHPLPPDEELLATIRDNLSRNVAVVIRASDSKRTSVLPIDLDLLQTFDIEENRLCESHSSLGNQFPVSLLTLDSRYAKKIPGRSSASENDDKLFSGAE